MVIAKRSWKLARLDNGSQNPVKHNFWVARNYLICTNNTITRWLEFVIRATITHKINHIRLTYILFYSQSSPCKNLVFCFRCFFWLTFKLRLCTIANRRERCTNMRERRPIGLIIRSKYLLGLLLTLYVICFKYLPLQMFYLHFFLINFIWIQECVSIT